MDAEGKLTAALAEKTRLEGEKTSLETRLRPYETVAATATAGVTVPKANYDAIMAQKDQFEKDFKEKNSRVSELEAELTGANTKLADAQTKLTEAGTKIAQKDAEIANRGNEIRAKDTQIAKLQADVKREKDAKDANAVEIAVKQGQIASLTTERDTLRTEKAALTTDRATLAADVSRLTGEVATEKATVTNLRQRLAAASGAGAAGAAPAAAPAPAGPALPADVARLQAHVRDLQAWGEEMRAVAKEQYPVYQKIKEFYGDLYRFKEPAEKQSLRAMPELA